MGNDIDLSIVIPCLNEEKTIESCIIKAKRAFKELKITGEVIVVDNGSTDRSVEVAKRAGARIVHQNIKGYGSALKKGFEKALGKYIIMGDGDDTYDLSDIKKFWNYLSNGIDFVIGSRLKGKIYPKAMPWLHKYVGTPVLTFLLNTFFKAKITDVNCGMRGFTKEIIEKLDLRSNGMEFASEMIIKVVQNRLSIKEIPINLYPGPEGRIPHLNSFRDGWRHLRFMLLFCPKYLFLYPGFFMSLIGFLFMIIFFFKTKFFNIPLGISTAVMANALFLMGMQIALFGISAMIVQRNKGVLEYDKISLWIENKFTLERGIVFGGIIFVIGIIAGIIIIYIFLEYAYNLEDVHVLFTKLAIASIFFVLVGIQIIISSFSIRLFISSQDW